MTKKMLCVLALVMACTLAASAKDSYYSFTLRDTSGNAYCNVAYLRLYTPGSPVPKAVVAGYYYNADCDGNYYPGSGFKHAQSAYLQYGSGAILDMSTPAYFNYTGTNTQLLVNTTYSTWALFQSSDYTTNNLVNYGIYVNGSKQTVKSTKDAARR